MGEGAGRRDFFLPSPSPSSMSNPSSSPLKSVIDSPQLSGSNNVQDGGIALFPPPPQKKWIALRNTPALQASSH